MHQRGLSYAARNRYALSEDRRSPVHGPCAVLQETEAPSEPGVRFSLLNVLDHILRYVALAQMWACGARAGI